MIKSSEQPPIKPNKGSLLEGLGNTDTDPAVLAREISVDEGWLSKLKALAGGIENFKQWDFSLMFKDTGQDGEYIAAAYLEKEGYKILARNFHTRQGELDIVCQFNEELVFVEVKTRHNDKYGLPEESMTEAKKRKILLAAQYYLQQVSFSGPWRCDFIGIIMGDNDEVTEFTHIPNAIEWGLNSGWLLAMIYAILFIDEFF